GDNLGPGLRRSCSFLRSGSRIITAPCEMHPQHVTPSRGLLTQAAQLVVDLIAVVPQRLDAVGALLCVEVALAEYRARRLDLSLDITQPRKRNTPSRECRGTRLDDHPFSR